MPSGKQFELARILLGMSQKELAQRFGVSHQTVSNIETERSKPPYDKIQKLQNYFENAGVSFTQAGGVEPRSVGIMTFEGYDGFADFRLDVIEEVKKGNPRACVSNIDEAMFNKWGAGKINEHFRAAVKELITEDPTKRFRLLVKKTEQYFPALHHGEYRWIPNNEFGDFPFYIYGNKTALIPFSEEDLHIFVINHPKITDFFRKQFEEKWALAKPLNKI